MADPITTYISAKTLPKLLKPLIKALKDEHDKRKQAIIYIGDNFGNPEALAEFYVEPNAQDINPADEIEDDAISSKREPIFESINNFLNRKISNNNDGLNQHFILADAGMGKTSLLMMLKLTHLMNFWPTGYQSELFKLGPTSLNDINNIKDQSNTLLLLDSLDEDPSCKDGNTEQRLISILDASKHFKRVIITCRTQFFPDDKENDKQKSVFHKLGKISIGNYSCPLTYLSLFDETQVNAYLEKRYPKSLKEKLFRKQNPKIAEASQALTMTDSLQFRPFLLAHIEDIIESTAAGANEYEVYFALVDKWLDREVGKLREKNKTVKKQDLLKVCIWLAEKMHRDNSTAVPLNEIEKFCERKSNIVLLEKPEQTIKGLDTVDISANSLLNRNSQGEFRFSHLSIKEFLVVYGVANNVIDAGASPYLVSDKICRFIRYANINKMGQFVDGFGRLILTHCQLQKANLRKIDLSLANLYDVNLTNADLTEATLHRACLNRANLYGINLSKTNLIEATLFKADLFQADLTKADLRKADLSEADLSIADLSEANLRGANLSIADLSGANLREANLTEADLRGAFILKSDLKPEKLKNTKLPANYEAVMKIMDF